MRDMELLFRGVISVRGFVIEPIFERFFGRIDHFSAANGNFDGNVANFHADPS